MRYHVAPASRRIQLQKGVGWHTFRHTYATMLKQVGTDIKAMQELLRHSSVRCTLDTYTQAIMLAKRVAQNAVLSLIFAEPRNQPRSPRVAVNRKTSAPSDAYFASVPPTPRDSSSGWASTAIILVARMIYVIL